jgi:hypothetical protein
VPTLIPRSSVFDSDRFPKELSEQTSVPNFCTTTGCEKKENQMSKRMKEMAKSLDPTGREARSSLNTPPGGSKSSIRSLPEPAEYGGSGHIMCTSPATGAHPKISQRVVNFLKTTVMDIDRASRTLIGT